MRCERYCKVRYTLYARECRVTAGLAEEVTDRGGKGASARLDSKHGSSNCNLGTSPMFVAKKRKCCVGRDT